MLKICYARREKRSGIGEETVGNGQSQKEQLEPGERVIQHEGRAEKGNHDFQEG